MMPSKIRLKTERDIKRAAKGGAVFSRVLVMRYLKNKNANSRFAVVVSTKVSKKAVVRNLIRRRLAAILTKAEPFLLFKVDAVVSAKVNSQNFDFSQLKLEVWNLLQKAKLVSPQLLRKK
jgi:ribonuclease P protein component